MGCHEDINDIITQVKLDALKFDGCLDPNAFNDWSVDFEDYFDWALPFINLVGFP